MQIHAKRNSLLALSLLLSLQLAFAQQDPPPAGNNGGSGGTDPNASGGGGGNGGGGGSGRRNRNWGGNSGTGQSTTAGVNDVDASTSTTLDYLFNHKPGEGTTAKGASQIAAAIADKIKAVDVLKTPGLDMPEVRARFQVYLSLKEVPQDRITDYFNKMTLVSQTLKSGDTFTAWKMLYALAEYKDIDAGISRELAAHVESIWNSDRTRNSLAQTNDQLQKNIETYDHNADLIADDLHQQALLEQQKQSSGNKAVNNSSSSNNSTNSASSSAANSPLTNPNADPTAAEAAIMPTMSSALERKMELTNEYLKLLEARAKIKLNEIKANKMSDQDRQDFSDYIRTLYNNHRYYHVIMAADFYRAIFNEGEYPSDVANAAVSGATGNARQVSDAGRQMAGQMGFNPRGAMNMANQFSRMSSSDRIGQTDSQAPMSIADEVTSALEINNRVSQSIEVFRYKADKGEIASAASQLQDAFVANEFHPSLQGLPRDEKEKVGDFLTKLDVLKNQLEVRDFGQVEGQIDSIKKVASDFDATKPMALVNSIKLESRLRLGKARLLAQGGQLDDAMQEFQAAAEEWPANPDLQSSALGFFNTEDVQNQSTAEFDRLVKDQNYRAIFDKQVGFAPAIKGDAKREQQFKDALVKVGNAEAAAEKANMQVMNGDVNGAWETIKLATNDWPDDTKLNKLLASLSSRSADFVSALNKAQDAESKKEYGYSLTWYVNAQSYYPSSSIANDGIQRLSKQVLAPGSASSTN